MKSFTNFLSTWSRCRRGEQGVGSHTASILPSFPPDLERNQNDCKAGRFSFHLNQSAQGNDRKVRFIFFSLSILRENKSIC